MKIGYALTGSFCTVQRSLIELRQLAENNTVIPIVSENVANTDTRFGTARETLSLITGICGRPPIASVVDAEPLGPSQPLDALIICPCTGNGITDTSVTMTAKAHLRCDRPLIIAVSSNDALSQNLKNIATMLQRKSVYFVPFRQDSPTSKPHSLVSDFGLLSETLNCAMNLKQLQPLLI